jgi:GNAT superfamily N-acetyltransferase
MITIRKATVADLDSLVPLFDAYRQFYKQETDQEGARKFLTERLEGEESVVFLAFDGERPAGFTQLYPIFSSVGMRRSWLLNDLYVDVVARKKGVGERLLEEAKTWARATGASWMMLETAVDNHLAQALYEKNGWERVKDELFYRVDL